MKRCFKWLCLILTLLLILGVLVVVVGGVYLLPYTQTQMDLSLLPTMYQGSPAKLYASSSENRVKRQGYVPVEDALPYASQKFKAVTYGALPQDLIDAFVAIEDKRFFQHHGVDLWRTGQACLNYVVGKSDTFGGSTISQQLVKNLTSRNERTPDRKLTEMFSALDMEKHLHKEEILEAYLNVINLGNGCRGVGAASVHYFGKEVGELSLWECATLAAITNNPSYYDPIKFPQNNLTRRNLILDEMCKQGYISSDTCSHAKDMPIETKVQDTQANVTSSWYADMVTKDVIQDLQDKLGFTLGEATALVYHGDLVIETAMDPVLQDILSAYYANTSHFPTGEFGTPQSAMMIIDPTTGDILAVAGAVGEKSGYRIQNYATDTRRPAGSCIKPLSVYAPALERGLINFASVFEDEPLTSKNGIPWPRNADGMYRGKISVREAVALSTNTVAVKILEKVGLENAFSFLSDRLHMKSLIPPDKKSAHDMTTSALALGQQSHGVTLREVLGGYTICYEGVFREPISYHRVLTASGEVLLSHPCVGEVVLSQENACILTHLLRGVVQDGSASSITMDETLGISVAGKTGTTQNNCDRWFVGLTPRLMAAVWVGYEYPQEMRGISGNPCLGIWDEVMTICEQNYRGTPWQSDFSAHPHVIPMTVCPHSGMIATDKCQEHLPSGDSRLHVYEGWFDVSHYPSYDCPLHTQLETSDTESKNE